MSPLQYIVARLSEASTWAGIGTALLGMGVSLPPGVLQNVTLVGTGIAGLVAILVPEAAPPAKS